MLLPVASKALGQDLFLRPTVPLIVPNFTSLQLTPSNILRSTRNLRETEASGVAKGQGAAPALDAVKLDHRILRDYTIRVLAEGSGRLECLPHYIGLRRLSMPTKMSLDQAKDRVVQLMESGYH